MIKKIKLFLFLLTSILAIPAWANLPYHPIQFPRDDAGHYDNVPYPVGTISEWWYYNGKLTSKTGRKLGYYIAYSYTRITTKGKNVVLPQYHIQITDLDTKKVYGNTGFIDKKHAYIATDALNVTLDNIMTLHKSGDIYQASGATKSKQGPRLEFNLQMTPTRSALLAGGTGLVDMWDNTNSYYYSYTHLKTAGYITIGKETFEIDPEQSISWMDHQWGDFIVAPWNQWLWASIQLKNGIELDLAVIMDKRTGKPMTKWMNLILPDDSRIYLKKMDDFYYEPGRIRIGQKHPTEYGLWVPSLQLTLHIKALAPGQDVNGLWEGISGARGMYQGGLVKGQANTENSIVY